MNNLADFVRNRGIKDSTEDDIYLSKYNNLENLEDTLAKDIKNEHNEQIEASPTNTNSSNTSKKII